MKKLRNKLRRRKTNGKYIKQKNKRVLYELQKTTRSGEKFSNRSQKEVLGRIW
jgi:hypothetical protein